jgi:hypothetical protein
MQMPIIIKTESDEDENVENEFKREKSFEENETDAELKESLIKQKEAIRELKKDSIDISLPDIPKSLLHHRPSAISRQSIEKFLASFPSTATEYADKEFYNTFHDIMKSDFGTKSSMTLRKKLQIILNSHKFHLIYIFFVVLDCICVITQMILDIIHLDTPTFHLIEDLVEYFSVFLLSLFLLEIILKLLVLTKRFLKSKLEIFDAIIIITSLCFEIMSIIKKDKVRAIEAIAIAFRYFIYLFFSWLVQYRFFLFSLF